MAAKFILELNRMSSRQPTDAVAVQRVGETEVKYMSLEQLGAFSSYIPDFTATYQYYQNEVIYEGGNLYRALINFTSGPVFDPANWQLLSTGGGSAGIPDWEPVTAYATGTVVYHGYTIQRALTDFTSGSVFNQTNWEKLTTVSEKYEFVPVSGGSIPAYNEGTVYYDAVRKTLVVMNDSSDVRVNLGEELVIQVQNNTGAEVPNGSVVFLNGATGSIPTIGLAKADVLDTSTMAGLATQTISDGGMGYVAITGYVDGVDTSAWAPGTALYLSATTAGALTSVSPPFSVLAALVVTQGTEGRVLTRYTRAQDNDFRAITNSGLLSGGTLSATLGNTTFDISDGNGVIVDSHNDPFNPTITPVQWAGYTGIAIPDIATQTTSFVYIGAGNTVQFSPARTIVLERNAVFLGQIVHSGGTIEHIANTPTVAVSIGNNLKDLEIVTGAMFVAGSIWGAAAADLNTELTEGSYYFPGSEWHTDKIDPNFHETPEQLPVTFDYVKQDGVIVAAGQTEIDPTQVDINGTLEPVGGGANDTTIQYLFTLPGDKFYVMYGQHRYTNQGTAASALLQDLASSVIPDFLVQQGVLCGAVTLERDATDLSTTTDATFYDWGVFGGGSGGVGGGTGIVLATNVIYDNSISELDALNVQDAIDELARMSVIPDWMPDTKYLVDEMVQYDGHLWRSNTVFTSGTVFNSANWVKSTEAMRWKGSWVPTSYSQHDVVLDDGWLMIANKDTTERAAPIESGSQQPTFPVEPVFVTSENAAVIYSGHQYTFTESGWAKELIVYVPELSDSTNYRIVLVDVTDPANPIYNSNADPILVEDGWATVALSSVVVPVGTVWNIFIDALNTGADTTLSGGWTYNGTSNADAPATQGWNNRTQQDTLRFDKTDLDSVDRTSELLSITPNSTLLMAQTNDVNKFWEYRVTGDPVDQGTYVEYPVTLQNTGEGGVAVGETTTATVTIPVAQTTKYSSQADYWQSNTCPFADVVGILQYDGVDQPGATDDAFGIDIVFQPAYVSPDWDMMSNTVSSGSSGSGGGGGSALETTFDNTVTGELEALNVQEAIDTITPRDTVEPPTNLMPTQIWVDTETNETFIDIGGALVQQTLKNGPFPEERYMLKQEFDALAEKRIRDNAGSGIAEWGKHRDGDNAYGDLVGQGLFSLYYNASFANSITIGLGDPETDGLGVSRTKQSVVNVNGVSQLIYFGDQANIWATNRILFPPAPDGTVTYDSATGAVVQHADSATAFAAETATNKVVIDRQDYCFLETWHEAVSDKDIVVPLGNVQYRATTYDDVTLALVTGLGVAQGYSAFGEWDDTTIGYGVKWSTLSFEDKAKFLKDHENNLYYDPETEELVQVRYRIRTIAGAGNGDWLRTTTTTSSLGWYMMFAANNLDVSPVGKKEYPKDYNGGADYHYYGTVPTAHNVNQTSPLSGDSGAFVASTYGSGGTYGPDATLGYNGLCFAIPICMVNRLNQGGYHPVWNPQGTARFLNVSGAANSNYWYVASSKVPSSTSDCFALDLSGNNTVGNVPPFCNANTGAIANGTTGRPDDQYYDAIYAAYVQDLRMSSLVRTADSVREQYKRKVITGTIRGWEKVPFTEVELSVVQLGSSPSLISIPDTTGWSVGDLISVVNAGSIDVSNAKVIAINTNSWVQINGTWPRALGISVDVIHTSWLDQRAQEHTWNDIVGDPERIAATFPNGVQGQWIPVIPDGTAQDWPFNRKALSNPVERLQTFDDGLTWELGTRTVDLVQNAELLQTGFTNMVRLYTYTTPAHFTEDADNATALVVGEVFANVWYFDYVGCLLTSSLINKVNTGASGNRRQFLPLTSLGIDVSLLGYSEIKNEPAHGYTEHLPINLTHTNDTPAVKTLDYLTAENGKFNLQYAYKEMIYDGTWGDDNQFQITDGQSTTIDTNGNTVLYGTAKLQDHCVQYFFPVWEDADDVSIGQLPEEND